MIIFSKKIYFVLLSVAMFIVMFYLSYGKWGDPIIDFGRELYISWALNQGKILYTDIYYFNGPLSPYFNSLVFKCFGPGIDIIVFFNLVLTALLAILIYITVKKVTNDLTAFISVVTFILLFAFSQYVNVGNYNFITPYSHEATHGTVLSWAMLAAIIYYLKNNKIYLSAGAGLLLGFIFLTKAEIYLAAMVAFLTAVVGISIANGLKHGIKFGIIGALVSLIPIITSYLILASVMPHNIALYSVVGAWKYVGLKALYNLEYYNISMGLKDVHVSIMKMIVTAVIFQIVIGAMLFVSAVQINIWRKIVLLLTLVFVVLIFLRTADVVANIALPLPLLVMLSLIYTINWLWRQPSPRSVGAVILCSFSFVLLFKIILNTRIYHYGFYLAMPATIVIICLLFSWLPDRVKKFNNFPISRKLYLMSVAVILSFICVISVKTSYIKYNQKQIVVASGDDRFYADRRGILVNLALKWLKNNTNPDSTVLILPEGSMINYLSRKINSTPITNLLPPEIIMFDERNILQAIKNKPPTYTIILQEEIGGYGYKYFGKDYGIDIMKWIQQNYKLVNKIEAVPMLDKIYGVLIMKYKLIEGALPILTDPYAITSLRFKIKKSGRDRKADHG